MKRTHGRSSPGSCSGWVERLRSAGLRPVTVCVCAFRLGPNAPRGRSRGISHAGILRPGGMASAHQALTPGKLRPRRTGPGGREASERASRALRFYCPAGRPRRLCVRTPRQGRDSHSIGAAAPPSPFEEGDPHDPRTTSTRPCGRPARRDGSWAFPHDHSPEAARAGSMRPLPPRGWQGVCARFPGRG
jgi:hypothetical protein